jgi:single-stranded DNA-binding protein
MTGNQSENNIAKLTGCIDSIPVFSHEVYGEGFYVFIVRTRRLSNSSDLIPVTVSDRLVDIKELQKGRFVSLEGQFRSYNSVLGEGQVKLTLTLFVQEITFPVSIPETDVDTVEMNGFICKPPVYRTTPFNREISDFLLAVNRSYNKSDYLPCICWGRNARFCGKRKVGDHVKVIGRMQSRAYQKKMPDGTISERTAYEVSVSKIELIEDKNETEQSVSDNLAQEAARAVSGVN